MYKYIASNFMSIFVLVATYNVLAAEEIKLESKVLSWVDGSFVDADTIELIQNFRRKIISILVGDIRNGKRVGHYDFQGEKYSIKELCIKEEELGLTKELTTLLKKAKKGFIELSDKFKVIGSGAKQTMGILIEESCTKRNRSDSLLLVWAHTKEEEEAALFDKHVSSFKDFEIFCIDLINYLGDMVHSCPKAQEQLKQRLTKWTKIKNMLPKSLSKETEMTFLKYIKMYHLDKLDFNDINAQKIKNLFDSFKQQNNK